MLFKPLPDFVTEDTYEKVLTALDLADKSPEERIKALLTVPADDLWQKISPGTPLLPSLDGDTVPGVASFETVSSEKDHADFPLPGRKWCAGTMIGESKLDVSAVSNCARISLLTETGKHLGLYGS